MKRDMELIRMILVQLEDKSSGVGTVDIVVNGYKESEVGYNSGLVVEAGLARGIDVSHMGSRHPEWKLSTLTWEGHEFLDASREPTRWEKAKEISGKAGGLTLAVMLDVLKQLMRQQVEKLIT